MRKMMMKMTRLCDRLMNGDDYDDAYDADDADEDYKTMWQADCSGRLTALKWIVPRRWSSSWPKRTGLFRISLSWWRLEEVDGVPLQVSSGYNHHDEESLVEGHDQCCCGWQNDKKNLEISGSALKWRGNVWRKRRRWIDTFYLVQWIIFIPIWGQSSYMFYMFWWGGGGGWLGLYELSKGDSCSKSPRCSRGREQATSREEQVRSKSIVCKKWTMWTLNREY